MKFRVIGGQNGSWRFEELKKEFEFTGFVNCIDKYIAESDVVIGSGRVAIEAILKGKPTIAVGEALSIGLINGNNFDLALRTNFGDIAISENVYNLDLLGDSLKSALNSKAVGDALIIRAKIEYDKTRITNRIEAIYYQLTK